MALNVKFKINQNLEVNMSALDSMMFCELIYNFIQMVGLKEEHKASFFFDSNQIKGDSMKKLSDIGIKDNSVIEVKTEKPLDYKVDMGGSQFPQNDFLNMDMNMNNGNMFMNQNMNNFGFMNMNPNMNNFGFMNMNQNMNNFGFTNVILIIFNYLDNKYTFRENKDTPFSDLSRRFCSQVDIFNKFPTYFLGSRKILSTNNQTLSELHIHDNSEILVLLSSKENEEYINIKINFQDRIVDIAASKDEKFCDLRKKFCNKTGYFDRMPIFLLNSRKIEPNETRTLKELNMYNNMKIDAILESEVIGA